MPEKKIIKLVIYFGNLSVARSMDYMNPAGPFRRMMLWSEQLLNRYGFGININRTLFDLKIHVRMFNETPTDKNEVDFYTYEEDLEANKLLAKYTKEYSAKIKDPTALKEVKAIKDINAKIAEIKDRKNRDVDKIIIKCADIYRTYYNIENGMRFLPVVICDTSSKYISRNTGETFTDPRLLCGTFLKDLVIIDSSSLLQYFKKMIQTLVHEIIHAAGERHPSGGGKFDGSDDSVMNYNSQGLDFQDVKISGCDLQNLSDAYFVDNNVSYRSDIWWPQVYDQRFVKPAAREMPMGKQYREM